MGVQRFVNIVLFVRRTGAFPEKSGFNTQLFHISFYLLCFTIKCSLCLYKFYPYANDDEQNPKIIMGDLQQGHLKTGLWRCLNDLIETCKTS